VPDSLKVRIREDMTQALKAGDKARLGALRLLSAAITNREKELRHELSDEEVREVAAKEAKKRTESIEAFDAAGRSELAARERAERDVLTPFVPAQLADAEVDAIIDEAMAATGAASPQDMGKVMGLVMGRARGRVDGAAVQRKVRARLEG
jgi:uncharacterized protein YqeY